MLDSTDATSLGAQTLGPSRSRGFARATAAIDEAFARRFAERLAAEDPEPQYQRSRTVSRRELVAHSYETLMEKRRAGYSFEGIAAQFETLGVPISVSTLKTYLQEHARRTQGDRSTRLRRAASARGAGSKRKVRARPDPRPSAISSATAPKVSVALDSGEEKCAAAEDASSLEPQEAAGIAATRRQGIAITSASRAEEETAAATAPVDEGAALDDVSGVTREGFRPPLNDARAKAVEASTDTSGAAEVSMPIKTRPEPPRSFEAADATDAASRADRVEDLPRTEAAGRAAEGQRRPESGVPAAPAPLRFEDGIASVRRPGNIGFVPRRR